MDDQAERSKVLREINALRKYLASTDVKSNNTNHSFPSNAWKQRNPAGEKKPLNVTHANKVLPMLKHHASPTWKQGRQQSGEKLAIPVGMTYTSGKSPESAFQRATKSWNRDTPAKPPHTLKTWKQHPPILTGKAPAHPGSISVGVNKGAPLPRSGIQRSYAASVSIVHPKTASLSKTWKQKATSNSSLICVSASNVSQPSATSASYTATSSTRSVHPAACPSRYVPTVGSHPKKSLISKRGNKSMVWSNTSASPKTEQPTGTSIRSLNRQPALKKATLMPKLTYSYTRPSANYLKASNSWTKPKTRYSKWATLHRTYLPLSNTWMRPSSFHEGKSHTWKKQHMSATFHPLSSSPTIDSRNFLSRRVNYLKAKPLGRYTSSSHVTRKSGNKSVVFKQQKVNKQHLAAPFKSQQLASKTSNVQTWSKSHHPQIKRSKQVTVSYLIKKSLYRAKQKSFRSTDHCIFYNKFGKCKDADKCKFIHDPKRVAVCTQFLRGTCKKTDGSCLFVHRIDHDKMPVCVYFLRGLCHKDNCPYAHVNVNENAEICQEFLRGFCPNGTKCKRKHVLECAQFKESGRCDQGASCKLLHRKHPRRRRSSSLSTDVKLPKAFKATRKRRRKSSVDATTPASTEQAPLPIKPSFMASTVGQERITLHRIKSDAIQYEKAEIISSDDERPNYDDS